MSKRLEICDPIIEAFHRVELLWKAKYPLDEALHVVSQEIRFRPLKQLFLSLAMTVKRGLPYSRSLDDLIGAVSNIETHVSLTSRSEFAVERVLREVPLLQVLKIVGWPFSLNIFRLSQIVCGVLFGGYVMSRGQNWWLVSIRFAVGCFIPFIPLYFQLARMNRQFRNEFTSFLSCLSGLLRSGLDLRSALEESMNLLLSASFIALQLRTLVVGHRSESTRELSLSTFIRKVPYSEARIFAIALAAYRNGGGSLAKLFDVLSGQIRSRYA